MVRRVSCFGRTRNTGGMFKWLVWRLEDPEAAFDREAASEKPSSPLHTMVRRVSCFGRTRNTGGMFKWLVWRLEDPEAAFDRERGLVGQYARDDIVGPHVKRGDA